MSNDWIPIADATITYNKRYEVSYASGTVDVLLGVDIRREGCTAIRLYEPTPYVAPTPIDPGEGWRLLEEGEELKHGDEYQDATGWCKSVDIGKFKNFLYVYRRRIEPTYRPFANADEYKPHRERWLTEIISGEIFRLTYYTTTTDWDQLFKRYRFEDTGKPFGVEVVK